VTSTDTYRFAQIEAWMLHADCHPDNYWFAKSSLDAALGICVACESDETVEAGPDDLAELATFFPISSIRLRSNAASISSEPGRDSYIPISNKASPAMSARSGYSHHPLSTRCLRTRA